MKKQYLPEVKARANRMVACETIQDLKSLDLDPNRVILNALNPSYYTFQMPKSGGSARTIEAPEFELKALQRKLADYLQCVYYLIQPKVSYGYIIRVKGQTKIKKNILENARAHLGARFMLNVDFSSFFHQISTSRIKEILSAKPFRFSNKAAMTLAKLFTYLDRLPMGAPSSPVLSNFAAYDLDLKLSEWAQNMGVTFTRFVDDMTFSSTDRAFSQADYIDISEICTACGFFLNEQKTRFFDMKDEKIVTGLVLRNTIDIPDEFYHELKKDLDRLRKIVEVNLLMNKHTHEELVRDFKKEVDGKINFIGMIEGYDSKIFYRYRKKLRQAMNPNDDELSNRWTNFNYF